jgi:ribonuclease P protein component
MTKRFSFPCLLHLKNREEFSSLLVGGKDTKKINTALFAVFFHLNQFEYPRLGIAVAKRNFPTAVLRNRLKRIARESFRNNKENIKNFDIIIMFYLRAKNVDNVVLRWELDHCWSKVRT